MSDEQPAYDGFISYSHAADDLLAPRLQSALQRFAKPWWSRRAVRMFRDESSLSANPHLWSSIAEALDNSAWFVLLLSPDAANSDWVNQEIDYWITNREPSRILPVLTDGDFAWNGNNVVGSAVPVSLRGVFAEEPRWVDLRFARTDEQLDLQNPQFANAVADLASSIRGVPKDELASEDVRIHRNNIRMAWAVGAALTVLTVTSVALAVQSSRNASEAERNAVRADEQTVIAQDEAREAEEQRGIAEENLEIAEEQRGIAEEQRAAAQRSASLAEARELILQAEKQLAFDPELSTLLALEAIDRFTTAGVGVPPTALSVLRTAMEADHTELQLAGGSFVAVDSAGSVIATIDDESPGVVVRDWESQEVVERYGRGEFVASSASFSADGNVLAVSFVGATPTTRLWDRTDGTFTDLGTGEISGQRLGPSFHPAGTHLALTSGEEGIEVWTLSSPHELSYSDADGEVGHDFSASGMLVYGFALNQNETVGLRIVDVDGWRTTEHLLEGFLPMFVAWSPDETRIAAADQSGTVAIVDSETGEELARTQLGRAFAPRWTADGESLLIGGEAGLRMLDAATGEVTFEFAGPNTWSYMEVPSRDRIVAASFASAEITMYNLRSTSAIAEWTSAIDGLWRISFVGDSGQILASNFDSYALTDLSGRESSQPFRPALDAFWFVNSSQTGEFVAAETEQGWELRDAQDGEALYRAPIGYRIHGIAPNGSSVINLWDTPGECGDTLLVQAESGTELQRWDMGCTGMATFSHAGDLVAIGSRSPLVGMRVFDTATGEVVVNFEGTEYDALAADFSVDGSLLVVGNFNGNAYIFDVAKLRAGQLPEDALVLTLPAHDSLILQTVFSQDDVVLATAAIGEEPAKVWDLATGELLGEFGGLLGGAGLHALDFHPHLPLLAVTTPPNRIAIYNLDQGELIAAAWASVSHPMTEEECMTYLRRPCDDS